MHVNDRVVFCLKKHVVGYPGNFSMRTRPAVANNRYFLKNDASMVSTINLKNQGIHAIGGFIDLGRFKPLLKSRHPGMSRTDPARGAA